MDTTLNISVDMLYQINKAAKANRISRTEMILLLIKKTAANIPNPGKIGSLVRYQGRRNSEDWHVFHIKIREDMYEYCLDLRKLLKKSLSLILAHAVKRFLKKPLKRKIADNYLCKSYFIIKKIIDTAIIWKFIWGCPENLNDL